MMEISKFDPAHYLRDPETITAYLAEAMDTNDPAYICVALETVVRARGMWDVDR